jgi:DNA-binding NarL/FixJ family response regulator
MQPTLLIAESSPLIATEIAAAAERAGCRVIAICSDGVSALTRARGARPTIVTTDLLLPRMTGIQLVRELRRLEAPPVVLTVTAVTTRGRVEEAKQAGVACYVLKPLSLERLQQSLARIVREVAPVIAAPQAQVC